MLQQRGKFYSMVSGNRPTEEINTQTINVGLRQKLRRLCNVTTKKNMNQVIYASWPPTAALSVEL